jgi:hypothetical protein
MGCIEGPAYLVTAFHTTQPHMPGNIASDLNVEKAYRAGLL